MCGRYAVYGERRVVAGAAAVRTSGQTRGATEDQVVHDPLSFGGSGFPIRNYDARPTEALPIFRRLDFEEDLDRLPDLRAANWGLVPPVARSPQDFRRRYSTFNARAETLASSPVYGLPLRARRCLVPMRGFYEWQDTPAGKRRWYVRLPEEPVFACAGLWERWRGEGGQALETFTIIVCPPNALMTEIHNSNPRMPAIVPAELHDAWMDPAATLAELEDLLQPFDETRMEAYPVPNRARGEELVRPLDGDAAGVSSN